MNTHGNLALKDDPFPLSATGAPPGGPTGPWKPSGGVCPHCWSGRADGDAIVLPMGLPIGTWLHSECFPVWDGTDRGVGSRTVP